MTTLADIPCVTGREHPLIDLVLPAQPHGAAIFFVHGGGWTGGARTQWRTVMEHFAKLGYVCASTSYRLAPKHRFPAQFEDVRLAFAWFRSRAGDYGFEPHRIAAWGSSAGGHLAALLATVSPPDPLGTTEGMPRRDTVPAAVVCLCTVFTVCGYPSHAGVPKMLTDFLGTDESQDLELVRRASPLERVRGGEPPLLMIVGDADQTTPVALHERMRDRLRACGGTAELHVLPGVGHGYGYGVTSAAQQQTLAVAEAFLHGALGVHGPEKSIPRVPGRTGLITSAT